MKSIITSSLLIFFCMSAGGCDIIDNPIDFINKLLGEINENNNFMYLDKNLYETMINNGFDPLNKKQNNFSTSYIENIKQIISNEHS